MQKAEKKEQSVYVGIWRSIVAVVALVLALGGTAIAVYIDKSITGKIEEKERAYLAGVDTFLSNQIISGQQTLNMLLTSPFIKQSIYTGNADWSSAVYQSGQIIVNAVNSNQAFNSIYVIAGDRIAIKSSRRYHTKEDEARLIQIMQHDFRQGLIPWRSAVGGRVNHHLMIISALDSMSIPNQTGGAMINLDLDRLAEMAFVNRGEGHVYMVMGDRIVASSSPEDFFTAVEDNELLAEAVCTQTELCRGSYVFSRHNETFGYTLYAIQDRGALMTPVKVELAILMLLICSLAAISLLATRRAALHAYTPVKTILIQLEEQLPAGGDAPEGEGLSELQRVSRSIRRTSEIVSAYRHDAETVRLSRFIHSGLEDQTIESMLEKQLGYNGRQTLHMLLYRADRMEDARMAADVLQGYLNGYASFLTLDTPGQRLLSLICVPQAEPLEDDVLARSVEQVLHVLREQGAGKVVITLHRDVTGVEMLHTAYVQLTERMRSSVFCAESTLLPEPEADQISAELTQRMYQASQGEDGAAYRLAAEEYLTACRKVTAREAYHQLATLCMRMSEASSNRNMDISDRLDSYRTIQNALFALPDYDALMAYMQELHQTVTAHLNSRRSGENNPLADRIVAYMSTHFDDPALSAGHVADALGVSVSHLSRVMSRSVGCGFPELLQKMRLEHACHQLMTQPGLSIAQLAQQCGFSSASYFTASFKRIYGVTPSGYRQRYMESKE